MTSERMILHHYGEVSSTNDLIKEMADKGAPEWTTVVAQSQSAGRGRMGRRWHSPRGNLYLSVLFRPEILPSELPRMSILSSLAVFMALYRDKTPLNLKWPNDILLDGRKIAGVLLEGRTQGDRVDYVVLGIGINLKLQETDQAGELAGKTAAVEEFDSLIGVEDILDDLSRTLQKYCFAYRGSSWTAARAEWSKHAAWGRRSMIVDGIERVEGCPVKLTEGGSLILETDRGLITVQSGDLVEA